MSRIQYCKNILIKFNWVFRHFLQNQRHDDLLQNRAINCLLLHKFSKYFSFSPLSRDFPFISPKKENEHKNAHNLKSENIKSLNRYIIITICYIFFCLRLLSLLICYIMDIWFKLNVSFHDTHETFRMNKAEVEATLTLEKHVRL